MFPCPARYWFSYNEAQNHLVESPVGLPWILLLGVRTISKRCCVQIPQIDLNHGCKSEKTSDEVHAALLQKLAPTKRLFG